MSKKSKPTRVQLMRLFSLPKRLRLASYGGTHFVYDQLLAKSPLLQFQTQPLDESTYEALTELLLARLHQQPQTQEDIEQLLIRSGQHTSFFNELMTRGWLQPVSPEPSPEDRLLARFTAQAQQREGCIKDSFPESQLALSIAPRTLFNVPNQVPLAHSDVAVLGVEVATLQSNLGTAMGADHMRSLCADVNWLHTVTEGFYSEVTLVDGMPDLLGRNVVFCDLGNLPSSGRTLAELFTEVQAHIDRLHRAQVRPLFIGGDHAMAFPIVQALLAKHEELQVLHLDAHNDLFYNRELAFTHSAPISNLLRTTSLSRVHSFGLRTFLDERAEHVRTWSARPGLQGRVALHPLLDTKRLIMEADRLRAYFRSFKDAPVYLTIDLDVLSAQAIGSQLGTPMGPGLEWYELFAFIQTAFEELTIVGCDINELNVLRGVTSAATGYYLKSLLILVLDRLAKQNQTQHSSPAPAPSNQQGQT